MSLIKLRQKTQNAYIILCKLNSKAHLQAPGHGHGQSYWPRPKAFALALATVPKYRGIMVFRYVGEVGSILITINSAYCSDFNSSSAWAWLKDWFDLTRSAQ